MSYHMLFPENNIFNFFDPILLIIVLLAQETPRKHKMPESIQARKNWIKSTQELKVKNN